MAGDTRLFNGTIFKWGGQPQAGLMGVSVRIGGSWVEVTMPEELLKIHEFWTQPDYAVQLKFRGCHELAVGDWDTAEVEFSNGFTLELPGYWMIGPIEYSGDQDAPWG